MGDIRTKPRREERSEALHPNSSAYKASEAMDKAFRRIIQEHSRMMAYMAQGEKDDAANAAADIMGIALKGCELSSAQRFGGYGDLLDEAPEIVKQALHNGNGRK